jgi:cold shock CspA family protein
MAKSARRKKDEKSVSHFYLSDGYGYIPAVRDGLDVYVKIDYSGNKQRKPESALTLTGSKA